MKITAFWDIYPTLEGGGSQSDRKGILIVDNGEISSSSHELI
jgi:hypothetical protein